MAIRTELKGALRRSSWEVSLTDACLALDSMLLTGPSVYFLHELLSGQNLCELDLLVQKADPQPRHFPTSSKLPHGGIRLWSTNLVVMT